MGGTLDVAAVAARPRPEAALRRSRLQMEDAAHDLAVFEHVIVVVAPTRGVAALEDQLSHGLQRLHPAFFRGPLIVVEHKKPNGRRKIAMPTLLIYLGNKLRYVDSALTRDFFQRVPKFVFKAQARLVAVEPDRALGDRRFLRAGRLPLGCSHHSRIVRATPP